MTEPTGRTPRIIAIANQKGGVGKTTTAINLGAALAAAQARCLIVDIDPQGNASTGLGVDRADRAVTVYDVLLGEGALRDALIETQIDGLDVAPSVADLAGAEADLLSIEGKNFRLQQAISQLCEDLAASGGRGYDFIFIDCPPSLNVLTVNALTTSHGVLVPVQAEFFALEGVTQLLETVGLVRESLNPALEVDGVLVTMFDARNKLAQDVQSELREHFGSQVYQTVIPRNVKVSEAPSHGKPVILYDPSCAGSKAYIALAAEMLEAAVREPAAA